MIRLARTMVAMALGMALVAPRAGAAVGDVAPRGAPDGDVRASDLVLATLVTQAAVEPTDDERLSLDVSAGALEPSLLVPPTFLSAGDGVLDAADIAVLRDAVLGRIRLLDAPGLLLRDGRSVAVVGEVYRNRLVLVSRSLEPVAFSLGAPAANVTVDPATGDLAFAPEAEQEGELTLVLRAEQAGVAVEALAVLRVLAPEAEATAQLGARGGTLEVTDPESSLLGVTLGVEAGVLQDDTSVTAASVDAAIGGDAGLPLSPVIVVGTDPPAPGGMPFEIAWEPPAEVIAAAGGADNLAWEALVLPFADCDDGASPPEARPAWASWVRLLPRWRGGALVSDAVAGCGMPAFLRLVGTGAPPPECPVSNEGQRIVLDVRRCPAAGAFTLAEVREAFEAAVQRLESAGYVLPDEVRVVVDDLPAGREAGLDPLTDGVVHVDRHLGASLLRVVAAHEAAHLGQLPFLPEGCPDRLEAAVHSAFLLEGGAAWLEMVVLDAPGDPDTLAFHVSRKYPQPARRSLDALGPEAWLFFNWMETSLGVAPLDVLAQAEPESLAQAGGALQAVDAALREAGLASFGDGLAEYMQQVNVERSPEHVRDIDRLWTDEPPRRVLAEQDTAEAPATLCGAVLPHASGITWILEVPAALPEGAGALVRVEAQGDARAVLYAVASGERLRDVPVGEAVSLGTHRGLFALHVLNPAFVDGAEGPAVADMTAWVVATAPEWADADGDGWLDETEREAGSDPLRAASTPGRVVVGWPSARAYLPWVGDPDDVEVHVFIGAPPARAYLPSVGDPGDVAIPVFLGSPPARAYLPWVGDPADVAVEVFVGLPPARAYLPWVGDPADIVLPVFVGTPPVRAYLPSVGDPADVDVPVFVGTPPARVTVP